MASRKAVEWSDPSSGHTPPCWTELLEDFPPPSTCNASTSDDAFPGGLPHECLSQTLTRRLMTSFILYPGSCSLRPLSPSPSPSSRLFANKSDESASGIAAIHYPRASWCCFNWQYIAGGSRAEATCNIYIWTVGGHLVTRLEGPQVRLCGHVDGGMKRSVVIGSRQGITLLLMYFSDVKAFVSSTSVTCSRRRHQWVA